MILSETQERFVKAIAAQVPLDHIAEIHFFQPIRQGGVESGVAVIATRPESRHPEPPPSGHPERSEGSTVLVSNDDVATPPSTDEAAVPTDESETELVNTDSETLIESDERVTASDVEVSLPVTIESGELTPPEPELASAPPVSPSRERHVIYTARYRLTIKGPDRGKWESNVVAEADAPLLTVDAVVRGVQRRSGEAEDAIRLTGEELLALTRRAQHPAA